MATIILCQCVFVQVHILNSLRRNDVIFKPAAPESAYGPALPCPVPPTPSPGPPAQPYPGGLPRLPLPGPAVHVPCGRSSNRSAAQLHRRRRHSPVLVLSSCARGRGEAGTGHAHHQSQPLRRRPDLSRITPSEGRSKRKVSPNLRPSEAKRHRALMRRDAKENKIRTIT